MHSCAGFPQPRKSRLRLLKSMSNAENFICSFSMSNSIDFGAHHSWNVSHSSKSPKNPYKPLFWHSRSSKVIEFNGNREAVYAFLLVINSNLGPISHRYWDIAKYWLQITNLSQIPSHLAPSFNVTLFKLWKLALQFLKLVLQATDGKVKIW